MTLHSINNLFLVEHDYQAEDLLNRDMKDKGEWIALGPSAMHYLSKKGIHYTIPEDYCSLNEIEDACNAQFEKIKNVSEKIDTALLQQFPVLKKWGIYPFLFNLWEIGMVSDAIVSRLLWLKKILENYPAYTIFIHLVPPQPWSFFGMGFSQNETLWGRLLSLSGWENEIVTFSIERPFEYRKGVKRNFKRLIKSNLILYNLAISYRNKLFKNALRILFPFVLNSDKAILINTLGEWKYFLEGWCKKGIKVLFLNYNNRHKQYAPTHNELNIEIEQLWDFFYEGAIKGEQIDYASLLKERIYYIINESPMIAKTIIEKIDRKILRENVAAMLNSTSVTFLEHVIKRVLLSKGLPVLQWQHGSVWHDNGRITQRVDLNDVLNTTHLLTYGEGVTKAYRTSPLSDSCKIESIGSIRLDRLSQNKAKEKKGIRMILYPLTGYYGNGWYCGFSPPFSDRLYYKGQMKIVEELKSLVSKIKNVKATIKLYSSAFLYNMPTWADDLRHDKNIQLKSDGTFYDMLNDHDIVLIDAPTTVLLEAIATKLHVFVLTSIILPPCEDISLLMKRAVCAESAKELMDKLEEYLETEHYPADVNDRGFLKLYGTYLDDGKSDVRAEALIKKFIDQERSQWIH
jgi:hypothetical protein